MVAYRTFCNTDPPRLVEVWNEALTGRATVQLMGASPLEYQVFSKPYFDRNGFFLAEEYGRVVGFAHVGLSPTEDQTGLSNKSGVICVVAVRPTFRRQGIGRELVRRCEAYLRDKGAETVYAGPRYPHNPFYCGLYGGSGLPGFLSSDPSADPFFKRLGYAPAGSTVVFHRTLQDQLNFADPRFVDFRQRFEIHAGAARARPTWWQNAVMGMIEPMEFFLHDKNTDDYVAEAMIGDLEGFSWRWNQPAIGIYSFEVYSKFLRQGYGKFFLAQLLRYFQEQCFLVAEVQLESTNAPAIQMCQSLGFAEIDVGKIYQRSLEIELEPPPEVESSPDEGSASENPTEGAPEAGEGE